MESKIENKYSTNLYIKRELASAILLALLTLGITILVEIDQVIKYKKEVRNLEKKEFILTEEGCYQMVIEGNRKVGFYKK